MEPPDEYNVSKTRWGRKRSVQQSRVSCDTSVVTGTSNS